MKQVIITVNGPGEISAWLTPLSRAIKAASLETRVLACLMPCVFSSGTERAAVERIGTVDAVAGISESFGLIFRKRYPTGFEPGAETLVLHLGGELLLSHLLARRLGAPAFAYVEHPAPILKRFERVFYNGLNPMPERIGRRGTEPVGEMMVDAALAKLGVGGRAAREPKTVAIFPGSRDYMAGFLLPYFAEAADRIAAIRPDISFVLPKSDYIADAWYRDFPAPEANRDWRASAVTHHAEDGAEWFETSAGTRIEAVSNGEVLKRAAVALSNAAVFGGAGDAPRCSAFDLKAHPGAPDPVEDVGLLAADLVLRLISQEGVEHRHEIDRVALCGGIEGGAVAVARRIEARRPGHPVLVGHHEIGRPRPDVRALLVGLGHVAAGPDPAARLRIVAHIGDGADQPDAAQLPRRGVAAPLLDAGKSEETDLERAEIDVEHAAVLTLREGRTGRERGKRDDETAKAADVAAGGRGHVHSGIGARLVPEAPAVKSTGANGDFQRQAVRLSDCRADRKGPSWISRQPR